MITTKLQEEKMAALKVLGTESQGEVCWWTSRQEQMVSLLCSVCECNAKTESQSFVRFDPNPTPCQQHDRSIPDRSCILQKQTLWYVFDLPEHVMAVWHIFSSCWREHGNFLCLHLKPELVGKGFFVGSQLMLLSAQVYFEGLLRTL